MTDAIAEKVLEVLEEQRFADWYNNGKFEAYISGDNSPKPGQSYAEFRTEETAAIKEDIKKMFRGVEEEFNKQLADIQDQVTKLAARVNDMPWERESLKSQIPENHEMGQ